MFGVPWNLQRILIGSLSIFEKLHIIPIYKFLHPRFDWSRLSLSVLDRNSPDQMNSVCCCCFPFSSCCFEPTGRLSGFGLCLFCVKVKTLFRQLFDPWPLASTGHFLLDFDSLETFLDVSPRQTGQPNTPWVSLGAVGDWWSWSLRQWRLMLLLGEYGGWQGPKALRCLMLLRWQKQKQRKKVWTFSLYVCRIHLYFFTTLFFLCLVSSCLCLWI